jgi:ribosomal protein S18 acetylase RimI-like enzyme
LRIGIARCRIADHREEHAMRIERVLDDPETAAALIADGGTLYRHALIMTRALTAADADAAAAAPDDIVIEAMDPARVADYVIVSAAAFPPGHPDHEPSDSDLAAGAEVLAATLRGEAVGPWMPHASWHAVDRSGRVVAAAVITNAPTSPAFNAGPFVTDVFVHPDMAGRGIGVELLMRAMAVLAADGHRAITLVVTVTNPARRVYERLGFRVTHESWRIDMAD